jgi:hypothetical protein
LGRSRNVKVIRQYGIILIGWVCIKTAREYMGGRKAISKGYSSKIEVGLRMRYDVEETNRKCWVVNVTGLAVIAWLWFLLAQRARGLGWD